MLESNWIMKRILILGGGFGGIFCARRLEKINKKFFDVELVSNNGNPLENPNKPIIQILRSI